MKPITEEIFAKVPKKVWPWLTLPRILIYGFFILLPAMSVSIMYFSNAVSAFNRGIDERVDGRVCKVVDSINGSWYKQIKRLQLLSIKTNTYLEVLMINDETRAVAESRWRRDSLMINNEFCQ